MNRPDTEMKEGYPSAQILFFLLNTTSTYLIGLKPA